MKQDEPEGRWEIPGAGTQRKTLLFQAGEGHVLVAILGRNGATQASMYLTGEIAGSAGFSLAQAAVAAILNREGGDTS